MVINKYNKYNVWRRYKTYDSGKTWVAMDDYEAYMTEENVESCGYIPVTYRWVAVDGTMCNNDTHTLYSRTRQQASYDRGQTWDWTEPAVYNYGDVIEKNSPQCGYPIYQWITVKGATMCGTDEATKYNQYGVEKEQVSTDNGISWTDTGKQREGKMIENLSLKCGYVPEWKWEFTSISCGYKVPSNAQSAITRVTESTEYCENVRKYSRQNIELSTDNGATWSKTDEFQTTLLESASTECGYAEQWVTVDGEYLCGDDDSRYTKYHKEKKQVSYDSGTTWNDTDETRKGDVIEIESTDCATPSMKVTYKDGTTKTFYNLTSIDEKTDSNKKNAKEVEIYDAVTVIGDSAFEECSSLTSITLPDSLTSINQWAFGNCSGLTSIVIPDSVTNIGSHTFVGCKRLTGITLSDSITSIEDAVFAVCKSLESIVIPTGVTSIGDSAFEDCPSLKSINIPTGVTSIGRYAFEKCSSLKSINIPTGVTSIGNSTFLNCSNLQSIEIPTGVISIDGRAFEGCSSLTGITISNSITSIGESAFYNCSSLTTMTVKATTPPTLGTDAITNTNIQSIYVPSASVDTYKAANGWKNYADKIQAIPS